MARSVIRGSRQWMPLVVRLTRGRSTASPARWRNRSTHGPPQLRTTRALTVVTCPLSRAHAVDNVVAAHELLDLAVVERPRAVADRRQDVLEAEPFGEQQEVVGVVPRAAEILWADVRLERQCLDGAQHPVSVGDLAGGEQVVEPHPNPHRDEPALGSRIHRDEERERAHELRREALERPLLSQGLAHEAPVEELEIAEAAVDELG